jgi:hypothetical protein
LGKLASPAALASAPVPAYGTSDGSGRRELMVKHGGMTGRAAPVLAALIAVAGVAQAQDPAAERRQAFILADVNGDGCLQLAEVAREMAWRFAALDADRDGFLTRDEMIVGNDGRFVRVDRDGDGRLSFLEVMEAKRADFDRADKTHRSCVLVEETLAFDGLAR